MKLIKMITEPAQKFIFSSGGKIYDFDLNDFEKSNYYYIKLIGESFNDFYFNLRFGDDNE